MQEYYGSCHCGNVEFKFLSKNKVEIWKCNCSICNMYVDAHDGRKRAVLACSALTASYRSILGFDLPHVQSVLLDGPESLIARRLKMRKDHFMPTSLLRSQIALLEPEHGGLTLNIEQAPSALVQAIYPILFL